MKFNKLVRDRIPEIIEKNGQVPITRLANSAEYWVKLKEKLQEEVSEFLEAETDKHCQEELVDILEVIHAMCELKGLKMDRLESLRRIKAVERGGFIKRIILVETIERGQPDQNGVG